MKFLKNMLAVLLLVLVMGVPQVFAHSGSPAFVTWSYGQSLASTDLNNALAHIHNTFSGGIIDAHISSSAAIAHSKLAVPPLVTKAVASVASGCTASATCTQVMAAGAALVISHTGVTGRYLVTYAGADAAYVVHVSAESSATGTFRICQIVNRSSATFNVECFDAGAANQDSGFHIAIWDN